jgi:hypothetical protein
VLARFDVLGSTLGPSTDLSIQDLTLDGTLSLLQDAEGNHCSSFPTVLLQLVRIGASLSQTGTASDSNQAKGKQALWLLQAAQSFDPLTWAQDVQRHSPQVDRLPRAYLATAHRAAVCIYLSHILRALDPVAELPRTFESLVAESSDHLSLINPSDPLFTATAWPTFVTGAETKLPAVQAWVTDHFQQLWQVEPWGLIRGALGLLGAIWERRARQAPSGDDDWVSYLRSKGVDWLIV